MKLKQLIALLIIAGSPAHLTGMEKSPSLFDVNKRRFNMPKPNDAKAFSLGAAIGGFGLGIGALAALSQKSPQTQLSQASVVGIFSITSLIGGAIGYLMNKQNWHFYNTVDGKNIHGCSAANSVKGIEAHLKQGIRADVVDSYGNTPAHYAVGNGALDALKVIIENPAVSSQLDKNREESAINKPNKAGYTTFDLALLRSKSDSFDLLINYLLAKKALTLNDVYDIDSDDDADDNDSDTDQD